MNPKIAFAFLIIPLLILGCIDSAGQEPITPPQENKTIITEETLKGYCSENTVSASSCGGYIVVVSRLLGGGTTYYKEGKTLRCPVVSPQYISAECKEAYSATAVCELEIQCESKPILPPQPPAPPKPVNLCENFTSEIGCTLQVEPVCAKVQKEDGTSEYRGASNGCVACSNLAEGEIITEMEPVSCSEMNLEKYTLWDVNAHDTAESCWVYAGNHLYDVSTYIGRHPGGPIEILAQCANNVSARFANLPAPGNASLIPYLEENYLIGRIVEGDKKLHP